jgi:hypothetical protein
MNNNLCRHVGQPSTENSRRDVDHPFHEERWSSTTSLRSPLSFLEPSGVVRHSPKKKSPSSRLLLLAPMPAAAFAFILVLVIIDFRFSSSCFLAAAFVRRDITRALTSC